MPLDPQWQYEVHTPPSVSPSRHAHSHKPPLPTPTTSRPVASLRLTPEALAAIRASPNAISVRFTNAPTSRSTSKVSQASGLVIGTQIFEFTPLSSTPMSQRKSHNSSVPSTEIYRLDSSSTGAARRKLEYQGKVSSTIALRMTLSKEKKLQVQKAVNLEGKKRESHGAILVDALELEREAFASAAASARKLAPRPKTTTKSLFCAPALPVRTKVMSPEAQIEFRKNLVHLMALKPISVSDILKRMGRDLEAHVMLLLKDIAKLQESNGLYKLQNQTYREVQPYTWPTYTYKEQELVAGNIKIAFSLPQAPG
ncbi:hypothetical protein BC829DRAFT_448361 [Chytridium lagenaria]|nr:hypothetical protein BC829DRAFT_448361 [Chytridium lagenaria]